MCIDLEEPARSHVFVYREGPEGIKKHKKHFCSHSKSGSCCGTPGLASTIPFIVGSGPSSASESQR